MSDTHTVINADSATALDATWQSCRVDAVCNGLSHAGTTGRHAVSAFITTGFARSDAQDIDTAQWREVADNSTPSRQSSPPEPKTGAVARMIFPTRHRISHARPVRSRRSASRPAIRDDK